MTRIRYAFCLVIALVLAGLAVQAAFAQNNNNDNEYLMYVGTYTGFKYVQHSKTQGRGQSHSKGIYVSHFHAATGELSEPELATEMINPSFLTISPNRRFLYSLSD